MEKRQRARLTAMHRGTVTTIAVDLRQQMLADSSVRTRAEALHREE